MLKSKLFIKSIAMVIGIIVIYSVAITLFTVPRIETSVKTLEEKNAKEVLNKVVTLTLNVYDSLESYKKLALQQHKDALRDLTDTAWSIIQTKYEQSKPQNIGIVLEQRAKEFETNLMRFYNKNKNNMTEDELKNKIKEFVNFYRYDNGIGYFWINNFTPKMILHPIVTKLNGKYIGNYKDPNGVYLFKKMVQKCKKDGKGLVKYQWLNPKTSKVEDKISYVFTFKPFNWIIGTGEYISVLQDKLQKDVINIVRNLRYGDGNYFFIYDYNNIAISHPYIQGKDMSNFRDKKGNLIVPPFIKIAREKGEGYSIYWWNKNTKDKKTYKKLTFVKDFPNWKMVIATGIFIDDIEKEVSKRKQELITQLKHIVDTTKIGKTGYLYIFDKDGNILIHPNKSIENTNFADIKRIDGKSLFKELVKASQTPAKRLEYKWDKTTDKGNFVYDKISWIEYIPELQWYIGSSVYVDEFKQSSSEIKSFIFKISLVVILLTLILSVIYFKDLLTPITKLYKLATKVTKGDYSVRSNIKQDDEIGRLSDSFNCMIDTTEDLILNLDKKILERTISLENAKKQVEEIHKHTKESIEYASLIQATLIPSEVLFKDTFKDYFRFWQPKDIVGGDIYLFNTLRTKDEVLLMVIDCTGHGVPGAFVTMLVKAVEAQVVAHIVNGDEDLEVSTSWIMGYFNKKLKQLLKQETKDSISNAGFDGGIIYYNKKTQILKFTGAETPLFYTDEYGKLHTIKGDRYSVGYKKCDANYEYKEHILEVKEGMKFYCTTDGYLDQNGGEKDFPFGKKRFAKLIEQNYNLPMPQQYEIFTNTIKEYEAKINNNDRNDDMTVIAFQIDKKVIDAVVLLEFEGVLTQGILAHSIDVIEHGIENKGMIGKISTLTIELAQNMINHSKSHDENSIDSRARGYIKVTVDDNEIYTIQSKNVVNSKDKEIITQKLSSIQKSTNIDIEQTYRDIRRDIEHRFDKDKGIGFYTIAKLSYEIDYSFKELLDDQFMFELVLKVVSNKNTTFEES